MTGPTLPIPVLDLDRDPVVVGREIDETLRTVGFFQVTGHGVDPAVGERCWDLTRAFFDLPLADKLAVERAPGASYGYFPMRSESLSSSMGDGGAGDLKESFNAPATPYAGHRLADDAERALFAAAPWPVGLPELEPAWRAYMREMWRLAERLMSTFALGLDLPADHFAGLIDRSPTSLRAINYPEQPAPPEDGALRAGAHTDYGTLTILRQELGRAGLEVYDAASGGWVGVVPVADAFVINIGDLMARWTNDRWTSTLHRVVNPDAGTSVSTRRQSMPFFFNANYDTVVDCLPTCVGEGARYDPVVAGPHLTGKFTRSTGPAT